MKLPDSVCDDIERLSEKGNAFLDGGKCDAAIGEWEEALSLVPEPRSDWEASTWLYSSIGDAYFQKGDYYKAKESLFDALNCPDGVNNPFIHYMLGKTLIKLNDENGIPSFLKAYLLDGLEIFELDEEGGEYLNLLKKRKLI